MQGIYKCPQYLWRHHGLLNKSTRLLQPGTKCYQTSSVLHFSYSAQCHSRELGPWTDLPLPGEEQKEDFNHRHAQRSRDPSSLNTQQRKSKHLPRYHNMTAQNDRNQITFSKRASAHYPQSGARSRMKKNPSQKFKITNLYDSPMSQVDSHTPKNPFEPKITEKATDASPEERVSKLGDAFDAEVEKVIAKGSSMTPADWVALESSLVDLKYFYQQWPTKVMKCLKNKVDRDTTNLTQISTIAISLHGYAKENYKHGVSLAMLGLLMSILGRCPDHHDLVFQCFEELQTRTDVLDSQLAQWTIEGLARTTSWGECLAIIEDYNEFASATTNHLSPIVEAAFHHRDAETGWRLLRQMGETGLCPTKAMLTKLFNMACNERDIGLQLLHRMQRYHWIPVEDTASAVYTFFESDKDVQWLGQKSVIRSSGYCGHCKQYLDQCQSIPAEDFDSMRKNFLKHSLIKSDVFLNSSPEELSRFTEFLSKSEPYTVVVDGLNVMLGLTRKPNPRQQMLQLRTVVDFLSSGLQHKVLVMGREHMLKWSQMESIQRMAQCFFTKDSSKDDPYMLYAALHGGPNTLLVTQDELRDHSVLLGPQRETFRLWQRQCQVVPVRVFWNNAGIPAVKFKWPDTFDTCVQQTGTCWHIPYDDHSERPSYLLPNTWLCMKPSR